MPKGYLALVLHAHLPYVRHPEYDAFLEERWLFEAMTETYIPLIRFCNRLLEERVPFKLTFSISPSLLAMLEDPLLQQRYRVHLAKSIELSEKELERTRDEPHFHSLAGMYRQFLGQARDIFFNQYQGRLVNAFKAFHQHGVMELITTTATHGLLPLLAPKTKAVAAQIVTGLRYFENVFGFRPRGIWLPECGYYPELETLLAQQGIRYFLLESHGLEYASALPRYGVYAPLQTPHGLAAFGRDQQCTRQVWSAREGFPGDPDYREFYRDIGHDLPYEYVQPYIADSVRVDTGIKYHRITGAGEHKEPYHPARANAKAAQHASDFLRARIDHLEYLASTMETMPIIVAPFDAELFGHWWFEGPRWLYFVLRETALERNTLELTTPAEFLENHPARQTAAPCTSTWGYKGYFEGWLNPRTDWIYPRLYECAERMENLAGRHRAQRVSPLIHRTLSQCVRELLLAQSSDWPFMINGGTSTEYATRRVKDHVARFHYLADALESNALDQEYLSALEAMDNIFPNADYRLFE